MPHLYWLAAAVTAAGLATALHNVEEAFMHAADNPTSAKEHLRKLTSVPHMAGTDGDFELARYVHQQFETFGLASAIENVSVLVSYPVSSPLLQRLAATPEDLDLNEEVFASDSTSDTLWRNHTFHGYSPSGDVQAQVVYANFGLPSDFQRLVSAGVEVQGKLALVRYGRCFRGLKVRNAQRHGAIGVLIYSDPAEDGDMHGTARVYPEGAWRPPRGAQRGSVQFNSLCSGDPGRDNVTELCGHPTEELIPRIPSVPLGYAAARRILENIPSSGSSLVPPDFVGGLSPGSLYQFGPTRDRFRLVVHNRQERLPIPNVVARIPGMDAPSPEGLAELEKAEGPSADVGSVDADQVVVLGNHRDAWVFGAADPNSGTASLLELARGLGALLNGTSSTGGSWRPRRSIYLCSWSGEELGLLGSTAWAEARAGFLQNRAVAYLNVDTAVSGDVFESGGSLTLRDLIEGAFADVRASSPYIAPAPSSGQHEPADRMPIRTVPWRAPMGSGSDFSVFVDHLGIVSADFMFARGVPGSKHTAPYGQYHSVYDSFSWMERFGASESPDPQGVKAFQLMTVVAQVWGLSALRLADSARLPLNHTAQALQTVEWAEQLEQQGVTADELKRSAQVYVTAAAISSRASNRALFQAERRMLLPGGLSRRKWFQHALQAPGLNLGYDGLPFPAIQDELDDDAGPPSVAAVRREVGRTAAAVLAAARSLEQPAADDRQIVQIVI